MLVVRRDNAVPAEVAIEHRAEPRGSAAPAAVHRVEVDPLPTIVRDS
jgi:hypothetical protein